MAQPKKKSNKQVIVLGMLLAVLAVMGARHFMGTRKSSASQNQPPAAAAPDAAAAATQRAVLVKMDWPTQVTGDPFGVNGVYPPKPEPKPATGPKKDTTPKPPVELTAEQVTDEALKTVKLQGMILGAVPRAVVNGRPVAAGDEIDGYRVVSIADRRIIVEKHGFEVEIELK